MVSKMVLEVLHSYNCSYMAGLMGIVCCGEGGGDDHKEDRTSLVYAVIHDLIDLAVGTATLTDQGTDGFREAKNEFLQTLIAVDQEVNEAIKTALRS